MMMKEASSVGYLERAEQSYLISSSPLCIQVREWKGEEGICKEQIFYHHHHNHRIFLITHSERRERESSSFSAKGIKNSYQAALTRNGLNRRIEHQQQCRQSYSPSLPLSLLFLSQKNILLAQTFTERVVSICMLHLPPSLAALHWLPNSEED